MINGIVFMVMACALLGAISGFQRAHKMRVGGGFIFWVPPLLLFYLGASMAEQEVLANHIVDGILGWFVESLVIGGLLTILSGFLVQFLFAGLQRLANWYSTRYPHLKANR
jgi:hypothetical protein